jgi:hypothetical protein
MPDQHPRDAAEIGKHVKDIRTGEYRGVIVDGTVLTGRWTVQGPDGTRRVFAGPDMQVAEDWEVPR